MSYYSCVILYLCGSIDYHSPCVLSLQENLILGGNTIQRERERERERERVRESSPSATIQQGELNITEIEGVLMFNAHYTTTRT